MKKRFNFNPLFSQLKKLGLQLQKKVLETTAQISKAGEIKKPSPPSPEFIQFQKRKDLKPAAHDADLSKVLEDVLQETPPQEGEGLYTQNPAEKK